jgi:hypothetical protein
MLSYIEGLAGAAGRGRATGLAASSTVAAFFVAAFGALVFGFAAGGE